MGTHQFTKIQKIIITKFVTTMVKITEIPKYPIITDEV